MARRKNPCPDNCSGGNGLARADFLRTTTPTGGEGLRAPTRHVPGTGRANVTRK
jgi:hypothetical protein